MTDKSPLSVPWWGWLFVAACVAIPIITVGGALPGALGGGAAAACASVSKSPTLSVAGRLGACAAITLGAWILFAVLLGGIAWLQR